MINEHSHSLSLMGLGKRSERSSWATRQSLGIAQKIEYGSSCAFFTKGDKIIYRQL